MHFITEVLILCNVVCTTKRIFFFYFFKTMIISQLASFENQYCITKQICKKKKASHPSKFIIFFSIQVYLSDLMLYFGRVLICTLLIIAYFIIPLALQCLGLPMHTKVSPVTERERETNP